MFSLNKGDCQLATFTPQLRGITRIIYQSLIDAAPQLLSRGQNIDENLLGQLKNRLRQELTAGRPNLVIEVLLKHSFEEIKQLINEDIIKEPKNVPLAVQAVDKPVIFLARP